MDEVKAAFGRWTHYTPGEPYFYSADMNYYFWFEGGKVTGIILCRYNETDKHNFLGFARGTTLADIKNELGEPYFHDFDNGQEYYSYSTPKHLINFVDSHEHPGIIESIEIY